MYAVDKVKVPAGLSAHARESAHGGFSERPASDLPTAPREALPSRRQGKSNISTSWRGLNTARAFTRRSMLIILHLLQVCWGKIWGREERGGRERHGEGEGREIETVKERGRVKERGEGERERRERDIVRERGRARERGKDRQEWRRGERGRERERGEERQRYRKGTEKGRETERERGERAMG